MSRDDQSMALNLRTNVSNAYQDGSYQRQNPDWHVEVSPWKVQQCLQMLRRHRLVPNKIGEIGCGAGEVLRLFQANMPPESELWGYDIAKRAIELGHDRANDKLHFVCGGVSELSDRFFDLLLVLDVVEHVEDFYGFLRDIRPKGIHKLFHLPLDLSVQTLLRKGALTKRREHHFHLHYFTKETALRALRDTGYEIEDWFYTPRQVDFPTGVHQKLVCGVRKTFFAVNQDLAVRLLGGYYLLVLAR
jgi:hypothetical protein